jgi:hypothetical protein
MTDQGVEMPYEVPPLPYDYAALEPHIDEATMRVHHDKHHQAYVDKVNAALEGTEWADKSIGEVVANLPQIPEDRRTAVRNNGGGHYNHSLFWESLSPDGGGEPDGELADAINSCPSSRAHGSHRQLADTSGICPARPHSWPSRTGIRYADRCGYRRSRVRGCGALPPLSPW